MNQHNHAHYLIVTENSQYMLLRDVGPWNEYKTVTNAAENVISELAHRLGSRKLYYIDSDGTTDELVHDNKGKFIKFKSGGPPAHNADW